MLWGTLHVSRCTVHLKYDIIHMLGRRYFLITDFAMSKGASKEELVGISRVRGILCAMFMSDIVKADCTYLEEVATIRSTNRKHSSK